MKGLLIHLHVLLGVDVHNVPPYVVNLEPGHDMLNAMYQGYISLLLIHRVVNLEPGHDMLNAMYQGYISFLLIHPS